MSVETNEAEDKYPVIINYLLIKLKLTKKSDELFELLKAIENTEREEIFQTKAIQNLIKYLWIRAKSTNQTRFLI